MSGPWREPSEESVGLYPGLVVYDGRVTGSITAGRSRLPLSAFAGWEWDEVVDSWPYIETEYGWTHDAHAHFLHNLLEMRGEFGRLLLVLADAERRDSERSAAMVDAHAVKMPEPWWRDEELRKPVRDQLHRCLAVLGG